MKSYALGIVIAACILSISPRVLAGEDEIYPTAVMPFNEQGSSVKGYGAKITEIVYALLFENPNLYLVDRNDINHIFQEQELNLSGMVNQTQMTQVGQMAGAKIIITGSTFQMDESFLIIAKVIGTETSRVFGAKVKGKASDDLFPMVEALVSDISKVITTKSKQLVAPPAHSEERVAALNTRLGAAKRPIVSVTVQERHLGQMTIDPAAQSEMSLILEQTGFKVVDQEKSKNAAIIIKGEGFSEYATSVGKLICVKARVEMKAIDASTGAIIASDRQTTVEIDLAERIAGKKALQDAAALIAERMLPKLVNL